MLKPKKPTETQFKAAIGADAVRQLMTQIDLEAMSAELRRSPEKSQRTKKIRIVRAGSH
jgi:DNA-directed RNA polymerase subunit beta'